MLQQLSHLKFTDTYSSNKKCNSKSVCEGLKPKYCCPALVIASDTQMHTHNLDVCADSQACYVIRLFIKWLDIN